MIYKMISYDLSKVDTNKVCPEKLSEYMKHVVERDKNTCVIYSPRLSWRSLGHIEIQNNVLKFGKGRIILQPNVIPIETDTEYKSYACRIPEITIILPYGSYLILNPIMTLNKPFKISFNTITKGLDNDNYIISKFEFIFTVFNVSGSYIDCKEFDFYPTCVSTIISILDPNGIYPLYLAKNSE